MGCYSALAGGGSQVIICTLLFFCISIFGVLCLHIWIFVFAYLDFSLQCICWFLKNSFTKC